MSKVNITDYFLLDRFPNTPLSRHGACTSRMYSCKFAQKPLQRVRKTKNSPFERIIAWSPYPRLGRSFFSNIKRAPVISSGSAHSFSCLNAEKPFFPCLTRRFWLVARRCRRAGIPGSKFAHDYRFIRLAGLPRPGQPISVGESPIDCDLKPTRLCEVRMLFGT